jgi:hypothetical protein
MAAKRRRPNAKTAPNPDARSTHVPTSRPTPVEGIAASSTRMTRGFLARGDRFSQLLGQSLVDEMSGQSLVSRSTLSDAERAELKALTPEAHKSFLKETEDATTTLRKLLAKGEPFHTLAWLQTSNLTARWGDYYEPTHGGLESKVELAAGLLVTQAPATTTAPASSPTMQRIYDEIERLVGLSTLVNLTAPTRDDEMVDAIRFTSALKWTTTRGQSYERHGRELALALYRPFASWSVERYGFAVDDVLAVGDAASSLFERRQTQARHKLADALNEAPKDPSGRPTAQAAKDAFEPFWAEIGASGSFNPDDVVAIGLDRDRVTAVLQELSIPLGSLEAESYRGLFDKNPLVERPFLELHGRYLLPVPGMVVRDTVALLEKRFMTGISTFSRARAKTLDRLAVDFVSSVLPDSTGFTNLHYEGTEVDGLVLFDRIALIIEGKGSALSVPARRGDTRRLASDVADTVEEAWQQGARAREYLRADADAVFTDRHGAELLRVPKGTVDDVFIIAPTLHELGGHAPQLPRLRSLGLFPDGEYPWSVFINDLRVISETADNAAVFLHYLVWRARLPLGDRVIAMDELDLWGCYLLAHRFGALANDGHEFIGNSTTDFDDYYAGLAGDGPKARKPEKFLKGSTKRFVQRMAVERPDGWLRAAGACLDLSIPEIAFILCNEKHATRAANKSGRVDVTLCDRVRLIGLPRGSSIDAATTQAKELESDATLDIYVCATNGRRPEIVWAEQVKPITFELSDYEQAAIDSLAEVEQ